MSDKVFTILRNNKEQGPFCLEEVLQFSLKPHDLVWIAGSVGWRAPSEVEVLQPYLNSPDRNFQKSLTSRIFISYPKKISQKANFQEQELNSRSRRNLENEEPTAESLEVKANQIYQRVMAYNDQRKQQQESFGPEGIYPLQELRQEYALWNRKKNKKFFTHQHIKFSKNWWVKSGIAGVIALGIFISLRSTNFKTKSPAKQLITTNAIFPVSSKKSNNVKAASSNNNQKIPAFVNKDTAQKVIESSPKELTVDEFIDSVRRVMVKYDTRKKYK